MSAFSGEFNETCVHFRQEGDAQYRFRRCILRKITYFKEGATEDGPRAFCRGCGEWDKDVARAVPGNVPKLVFVFEVDHDRRLMIATCPELGIRVEGHSRQDVYSKIPAAVRARYQSCSYSPQAVEVIGIQDWGDRDRSTIVLGRGS